MGSRALPQLGHLFSLCAAQEPALIPRASSLRCSLRRGSQARMMNLCAKNEYVLQRWLDAANLMILKEEGSYKARLTN